MVAKNIFQKTRIDLTAGIAISVILCLVLLFSINSLTQKNRQMQDDINKKRIILEKNAVLSPAEKKLVEEIQILKDKANSIETAPYQTTEEMLISLNRFAEEAKISFKTIDPLEKTTRDIPNQNNFCLNFQQINIRIKCDYWQLLTFLNKINNQKNFMKVDEINIRSNPNDIWSHDIQLNLIVPYVTKCETLKPISS